MMGKFGLRSKIETATYSNVGLHTFERWAKRFTEAVLKEGNLVKYGQSAVKS